MKILLLDGLNNETRPKMKKILDFLARDDFKSAEVKKIRDNLYRAKVDYADRLLFSLYQFQGETYALILEYLPNHDYQSSRFLRKEGLIDESKFQILEQPEKLSAPLSYVNPNSSRFNLLDKIISFDDAQRNIYGLQPPFIVIGSAGSGKTALCLEKMKQIPGDVLYVTQSPYLVHNSRQLYYSHGFENDSQNLTFLSFHEFLESIRTLNQREMTASVFERWFQKHRHHAKLKDAQKVLEEFRGVITGSPTDKAWLNREEYLNLGVRQSIFNEEERPRVYELFEKYLEFLKSEDFFDPNIVSFNYLEKVEASYDFIVVDEVQDLTNIQLYLVLKSLREKTNFMLCGDSNQIVHPNFFSWSKVKSLFHEVDNVFRNSDLIRILNNNYRNSETVTTLANRILKLKQARFGSIDKESNYLVQSVSTQPGHIAFLKDNAAVLKELNAKTGQSTRYAVLVMHAEQKAIAKEVLNTPLIFSIQEAKGLEYENIILFNFIGSEEKAFRFITEGVSEQDIQAERAYARAKDKRDKSLEVFKFYINALYVSVTRSVKNVYWLEPDNRHPLFGLLGLTNYSMELSIENQESSLEDWQKEASKLELQGKKEQADDIRQRILQYKEVPWPVYTRDNVHDLERKALAASNKKLCLTLLEYAVIYDDKNRIDKLVKQNFRPALNPEKCLELITNKHFLHYTYKSANGVLKETEQYGLDFRNQFNMTPLMISSRLGNVAIVEKLCELGADRNLTDSLGLNAFQIALQQAVKDAKYRQSCLTRIYELLEPESLSVQTYNRLQKLDNRLMEFTMFNIALVLCYAKLGECILRREGLTAEHFRQALADFPNAIIPERRKKRAYISSILSKNEYDKNDCYNRRLFLRIKRGHYILNPHLKLKVEDRWVPVYEALNLDNIHAGSAVGRLESVKDKTLDVYSAWQNEVRDFIKYYKEQSSLLSDLVKPRLRDDPNKMTAQPTMRRVFGWQGIQEKET